jgi:hypothetical protein
MVQIEKSLFNYLTIRTDTVIQRIFIVTYKKKQKYTLEINKLTALDYPIIILIYNNLMFSVTLESCVF